jgi:hypothetical protein
MSPYPPPLLHTVPYSHREGGRGGRSNQREGYGSKIPTGLTVTPVYKLYQTPVKTTFRVWCLYSYLVYVLVYALYEWCVGVQGSVVPVNTCEGVSCRPGRECVQLTNGENECVCMARCPDHWKPVSKFYTDGFISALLQIRIDIQCGSGSGSGSLVLMTRN